MQPVVQLGRGQRKRWQVWENLLRQSGGTLKKVGLHPSRQPARGRGCSQRQPHARHPLEGLTALGEEVHRGEALGHSHC